jgi:ABC-2 type transport system ATP-binding protein
MLEITDVSKNYGDKTVLNNVSFNVEKGEIVSLLGENGAGKSTLLKIICGFIDASGGKITVDGASIGENRLEVLRKIGYVQEISSLYGELTTYEFLNMLADIRQTDKAEKWERIRSEVKNLDLEKVINQRLDTLSKGFKKRVELAGVLLSRPEILLLDEPTEGLDPNQKYVIREIIKKYAKGHIVIISTHTMDDVEAVASRVVLLHKGNLTVDSKVTEFKKTAGNDLLKAFRKVTNGEV